MCLSPEVDVVAASAMTLFAVDALRHNHNLRSLPIALVPAIFAIHTFSDAFVWWGSSGQVTDWLANGAGWIYLFIAFVLLPVFVPIATNLIEPRGWRKNLIGVIAFTGLFVALDNMISLARGESSINVCDYYVDYHVFGSTPLNGIFYGLATIGVMLLSGQKYLFRWGVLNLVVVSGLAIWANHELPSLWCFWAAITSFFVCWFLRQLESEHNLGKPWPWQTKEKINVELV